MRPIQSALLALAALTAVACDVTTQGANGNVNFTPTECGRFACDFDDTIGVGGTIEVQIAGVDGVTTAGATLVSDDPSLLSVRPIGDIGGRPTWELQSLAAGVARLTVLDAIDDELDFIEVPMQEVAGLITNNVLGNAVGPSSDASFDEIWTVNADESVSFQVTPVVGIDSEVMGRYVYTATIDAGLQAGLIDDDLSEGYLYFSVPAGEYAASFVDDYGHFIDILIIAQ